MARALAFSPLAMREGKVDQGRSAEAAGRSDGVPASGDEGFVGVAGSGVSVDFGGSGAATTGSD